MDIDTVDWKLLGKCNLRCFHCYGPPKNQVSLNLEKLFKIIDRYAELGVRRVVLTGGEPLLVSGIDTILARLAEYKISIALSTNTSFFMNHKSAIELYVHSLNVPLDGPTPEIHALSRLDTSSFFTCLEMLRYYRSKPTQKPPLLRVGTVYSSATTGTFLQMAEVLDSFSDIISTWKIYELMEYEFQPELRERLRPEKGAFEREMVELLTNSSFGSKIMISPASGRNKAYFMVNPFGQLVLPTEIDGTTKEVVLGNFIDDPLEDLLKKWASNADLEKYCSNHAGHYGN